MTRQQRYNFARFVIPHLTLIEFSGMKCAGTVRELFGIDIEYNIYSDVLDGMYVRGEMYIIGHNADGMTLYGKVG